MSAAGYWYEFPHPSGWERGPSDLWDIVVYAPDRIDVRVGSRRIDGSLCVVFLCADGVYRARLAWGGEGLRDELG